MNRFEFISIKLGEKLDMEDDRAIYEHWYQDGNLFLLIGNALKEEKKENV